MAALDSLLGNETLKESLSAALCGRAAFIVSCFAARRAQARALPRAAWPRITFYPNGGASARSGLAGQSPEYLLLAGERRFRGYPRGPCARGAAEIFNTALSAGDAPCTSKARTS